MTLAEVARTTSNGSWPMWIELTNLFIVATLAGMFIVKDTLLEHNRNIIKSIKKLLPNQEAYKQEKIQEYVNKLLETAV